MSNLRSARVFVALLSIAIILPFLLPGPRANLKDGFNIGLMLFKSGREILGFEGQQKYLLVFQNTAEARGTGGIIGGYAVVDVNRGGFKIDRAATSGLVQAPNLPISLPNEFYELYNDDPSIWQNSNLSVHFPYGAKIWLELWKRQSGQQLNGVITVDPTLISYILKVTGPITMDDGTLITSRNVVNETLSQVYQKYETDNIQRKDFLLEMITKTFAKIQGLNKRQKAKLISPLFRGYQERRLLFYHREKSIEKSMTNLKSAGILKMGIDNDFRAVILNTSGNKLDYYLRKKVEISSLSCNPRKSRVRVTITNTASPDQKLPNYVAGRLDLGLISGKKNSQGVALLVYGPYKSEVEQILNLNADVDVSIGSERGRPVAVFQLDIPAKNKKVIELDFMGGSGDIRYLDQPLAFPTSSKVQDRC